MRRWKKAKPVFELPSVFLLRGRQAETTKIVVSFRGNFLSGKIHLVGDTAKSSGSRTTNHEDGGNHAAIADT